MDEAGLAKEMRRHPHRMRRIAEERAGRELSPREAEDVLRRLYLERDSEPEFRSVPEQIHQPPPGRVAVGCRVRATDGSTYSRLAPPPVGSSV